MTGWVSTSAGVAALLINYKLTNMVTTIGTGSSMRHGAVWICPVNYDECSAALQFNIFSQHMASVDLNGPSLGLHNCKEC